MELIDTIIQALNSSEQTLSTAEDCTSGYVGKLISSTPYSSGVFEGSLVVCSDKSKINILKIEQSVFLKNGSTGPDLAISMAENVKKIMDTDYSIATSGHIDSNSKGVVYIAVSGPEGTVVRKIEVKETKSRAIYLVSIASLEMFQSIIKIPQV